MKDHAKRFLLASAEHHVAVAKIHKTCADDGDQEKCQKALATEHTSHSEKLLGMCKAIDAMPSVGGEDLPLGSSALTPVLRQALKAAGIDPDGVRPTGTTLVPPSDFRLVPRTGGIEKTAQNIDPDLAGVLDL